MNGKLAKLTPEPKYKLNTVGFFGGAQVGSLWTFEDDFTSYTTQGEADTAWPTNDTAKSRVNITNDNMDFNLIDDGTNNGIVHDLTTVSDTAWLLRQAVDFTSFSEPSAHTQLGFIGISSTNQAAAANSAQDFLGLQILKGVDAEASLEGWYTIAANGAYLNGSGDDKFDYEDGAITTQLIYLKQRRLSSTSFAVGFGTTSAYTDDTESKTSTCDSTITSLQYIAFKNQTNSSRNATIAGTTDDIQFNNGVTTPP